MRLLTAHKILIGASIALFALLALWGVRQWSLGSAGAGLIAPALSAAAAAGLALYYRRRF